MPDDLRKTCVLLAEDEMLLAMMLEDRLEHFGYRVIKAARVAGCLVLAESAAIDVAILDINLAGEESFPVATVLRRRGIPFLFSSGPGAAKWFCKSPTTPNNCSPR